MKVCKIVRSLFQPRQAEAVKKTIPPCPILYDSTNVTAEEFRKYVHWLAENNINRTFYEPQKLITEAEREALEKRKAELDEYKKFVHHLSETNSNRTFITQG